MKLRGFGTGIRLLAVSVLFAGVLAAEPLLTTIDDMLYKADGSPFQGVLMINWRSFEGPGTSNIPANSLTAHVRDGRLYTKLVPTTTAPTAAYYSVRYVTAGSVQFTELWSVPSSGTPLRVRDVRIDWPPSTTAVVAPATDITIVDVEGLPEALDLRAVKGQGFAPSRAAVIGPTGGLEGASGEFTDCIRVDGSTGPCGSTAASAAGFVDAEVPAGVLDGSNRSLTLTTAPAPSISLLLYRNGLLQKQGTDFAISGSTITFTVESTPQPGDLMLASYRTNIELTTTYGFIDAEVPTGLIDGANDTFLLAGPPNPAASLMLFRNGLLQKQDVDYTISGATIVFASASTPQSGDVIQASYRVTPN